MRVVIQRCTNASVKFNEKENYIDKGLMVLLGITKGDTIDDIKYIIKKITNLRIFEDDNYKMNYSVKDINGSILLVSQFTLYASTKDGNRPSFTNSLVYDEAKELYDLFIEELKIIRDSLITKENKKSKKNSKENKKGKKKNVK